MVSWKKKERKRRGKENTFNMWMCGERSRKMEKNASKGAEKQNKKRNVNVSGKYMIRNGKRWNLEQNVNRIDDVLVCFVC